MNAIIKPTIGRRVWFWPADSLIPTYSSEQPCDAGIAYVWNDRLINITVAGHDGSMHARTSVPLLQAGDAAPTGVSYATWMPYQQGQADRAAAPSAPI